MDPITIALMSAGTLLGGFGALGENPQEKAAQAALDKLGSHEEWLASTPYSKAEITGYLIPKLQRMYRGAADIVASKVGASVGEMDGANFMEYYTQALGEVIGKGEENAAGIEADMNKWYAQLDDNAKQRFIQAISLELQGSGQLPQMNQTQKFITGALSGLNLGATAGSNIATAGAALQTAGNSQATINNLYDNNLDIGNISKTSFLNISPTVNVEQEMKKYLKKGKGGL